MIRYLLGRLGESVLAVLGVVTIVFVVTRLIGDPAVLMLPVGATAEQIAAFRAQLGIDRPIHIQYFDFLAQAAQGDFGRSFQHARPAFEVVLERMPATLQLASTAIVLGLFIAAITLLQGALIALLVGLIFWIAPATGTGSAIALVILGAVLLGLLLGWIGTRRARHIIPKRKDA